MFFIPVALLFTTTLNILQEVDMKKRFVLITMLLSSLTILGMEELKQLQKKQNELQKKIILEGDYDPPTPSERIYNNLIMQDEIEQIIDNNTKETDVYFYKKVGCILEYLKEHNAILVGLYGKYKQHYFFFNNYKPVVKFSFIKAVDSEDENMLSMIQMGHCKEDGKADELKEKVIGMVLEKNCTCFALKKQ